jgi:beta-glucanase (GH16 family)
MQKNKLAIALAIASFLTIGLTNIASASSVPTPTGVTVTTDLHSATVSWTKVSKTKVSSISLTATTGSSKIVRVASNTSTSYKFTNLIANTYYTFKLANLNKKLSSSFFTIRVKTKKPLQYNAILFGQPQDMVVGDPDLELFALPNGGDVSFTVTTPTTCELVSDTTLHAIAIGDCTIVAKDPGDSTYAKAPNVSRTITISAPISSLNKTLLWSDEFNGTGGPSADSWNPTIGDGCGTSAGCGWGNGEAESYAECALNQIGGSMVITASTTKGDAICKSNKDWTSGKFTSYGKVNFTYGYFEAKLKMPEGGGTWPAFWTLGSNIASTPWPNCGEIDIMEYSGNNPYQSTSALHYANSNNDHEYKSGSYQNNSELFNDYHTYGLLWLPNQITYTIDNHIVLTVNKSDTGLAKWPFGTNNKIDPKAYLIFNLAMGGGYGGQIEAGLNKAQYSIDYVRYYSVDGIGKVTN